MSFSFVPVGAVYPVVVIMSVSGCECVEGGVEGLGLGKAGGWLPLPICL